MSVVKAKLKWDENSTKIAVDSYSAGKTPVEIAAELTTDEVVATYRQVIAKLTHSGVYEKPKAKVKATPKATLTKAEIAQDIIEQSGFVIESLNRGTAEDLLKLASKLGVDVREPSVK